MKKRTVRSFHRVNKYGELSLSAMKRTWEETLVVETKEEEEARMQVRRVCFDSDRHDNEMPMTSSQRQRVLMYGAAVPVKTNSEDSEDSEEGKEDAAWLAMQEQDDGEVAPAAAGDDKEDAAWLAMQEQDDGEVAPAAAGDDDDSDADDDSDTDDDDSATDDDDFDADTDEEGGGRHCRRRRRFGRHCRCQ